MFLQTKEKEELASIVLLKFHGCDALTAPGFIA